MKLAHIVSQKQDYFYHEVVAYLASLGVKELAIDNYTANADFTVVLGGDGTVLAAGRKSLVNPFVVINTGHLGFLTSSDMENYQDTLLRFLQGSYTLTKRHTLRVQVMAFSPTAVPRFFDALNEVVIAKNQLSKLVKVAVYVYQDNDGGELVSEYRADGLIVSTPTGSTAYNLSAGGPIIHPSCDSFVIAPICPQGLTQRPLVLPGHLKVRIKSLDSQLYVSVDGQDGCPMHNVVDVSYNTHCIETVDPPDSYFQILRNKLGWGTKLI